MNTAERATKILDSMLGHLGFPAEIQVHEVDDSPCLQIFSADKALIIGKNGDRLDDIQYLVNRILRQEAPDAGRVKIDCEHYRSMQEEDLKQEVRELIELVKTQSKTFKLRPLNGYHRRLAYSVIAEDDEIQATSPNSNERMKRISISPK